MWIEEGLLNWKFWIENISSVKSCLIKAKTCYLEVCIISPTIFLIAKFQTNYSSMGEIAWLLEFMHQILVNCSRMFNNDIYQSHRLILPDRGSLWFQLPRYIEISIKWQLRITSRVIREFQWIFLIIRSTIRLKVSKLTSAIGLKWILYFMCFKSRHYVTWISSHNKL